MIPTVHFVTGLTCVGKTYFVNAKEAQGCPAIYTGKMARQVMSAEAMASSKNPVAPVEIDFTIRKMVEDAIHAIAYDGPDDLEDRSPIYVDAAPRSVDQVNWILGLKRNPGIKLESGVGWTGIRPVFTVLWCSPNIHAERIKKRINPFALDGEQHLLTRRVMTDVENLYPVLIKIMDQAVVPYQVINTDGPQV